jgi:L-arabinose isomerase
MRDRADVNLHSRKLFGRGDNRHRLAKHVVIGELERFEGEVWSELGAWGAAATEKIDRSHAKNAGKELLKYGNLI